MTGFGPDLRLDPLALLEPHSTEGRIDHTIHIGQHGYDRGRLLHLVRREGWLPRLLGNRDELGLKLLSLLLGYPEAWDLILGPEPTNNPLAPSAARGMFRTERLY